VSSTYRKIGRKPLDLPSKRDQKTTLGRATLRLRSAAVRAGFSAAAIPLPRCQSVFVLLIALLPDIEERSRDSKEPAGLTDVATYALRMLQHAEPGLHLPCLDLLVRWVLHPEPPSVGRQHIPPVRDVY
jgi:hypothetical protein